MFNLVLIIVICLVCFMGLLISGDVWRFWKRSSQQEKLLMLAWSAMIVGSKQFLAHDGFVAGVGSINSAAIYQLSWMAVAGALAFPIFMSTKIKASVWTYPIIAFSLYVFFNFTTAVVSLSPSITIYRTLLILIDLLLVLVAYSICKKSNNTHLLISTSIFWLVLLLLSVLFGALLIPDLAFRDNNGVLGHILRGIYPQIHSNELGLMAAVALIISVIRGLGGATTGKFRLFWFTIIMLSGAVLFLSQARTSLVSTVIALFLVGFLIKQLRWMVYAMVLFGLLAGAYNLLDGGNLGISDQVEAYARRGVSDEHLESLSGRTELWPIGWEMFKDSPVIGNGFQTGVRLKGAQYGLPLGMNMHSSHVQVLVDSGVLGYLAWFVFIFGVTKVVFKRARNKIGLTELAHMQNVENLLVIFVILFRSLLGHVLVAHQLNMMIFLAIYIYAVTYRKEAAADGVVEKGTLKTENISVAKKPSILSYKKISK